MKDTLKRKVERISRLSIQIGTLEEELSMLLGGADVKRAMGGGQGR